MNDDRLSATQRNLIELPDCRGLMIKPGDTVQLAAHPYHAGKFGTYRGVDVLAMGRAGAMVELSDGGGCYVFKAREWRRVSRDPDMQKSIDELMQRIGRG